MVASELDAACTQDAMSIDRAAKPDKWLLNLNAERELKVSVRPAAGMQRSHRELSFDGAINPKQTNQKHSARPRS